MSNGSHISQARLFVGGEASESTLVLASSDRSASETENKRQIHLLAFSNGPCKKKNKKKKTNKQKTHFTWRPWLLLLPSVLQFSQPNQQPPLSPPPRNWKEQASYAEHISTRCYRCCRESPHLFALHLGAPHHCRSAASFAKSSPWMTRLRWVLSFSFFFGQKFNLTVHYFHLPSQTRMIFFIEQLAPKYRRCREIKGLKMLAAPFATSAHPTPLEGQLVDRCFEFIQVRNWQYFPQFGQQPVTDCFLFFLKTRKLRALRYIWTRRQTKNSAISSWQMGEFRIMLHDFGPERVDLSSIREKIWLEMCFFENAAVFKAVVDFDSLGLVNCVF